MATIDDLDATQIRILGALLEKEQTTPDGYPLTVAALISACNQKSNRHPVTQLTEEEILDGLDRLRDEALVRRSEGARSERWGQQLSRGLELRREEKALLTLLMLRGPQTPGELRSRSGRLHRFASLSEVESALARMAGDERELVAELPRQPGQKERRWAQLLSGEPEAPSAVGPEAPALDRSALSERVARLEEEVGELAATVDSLRRALED